MAQWLAFRHTNQMLALLWGGPSPLSLEVVGEGRLGLVVEYTGLSQAAAQHQGCHAQRCLCEEHPLTVWEIPVLLRIQNEEVGVGLWRGTLRR